MNIYTQIEIKPVSGGRVLSALLIILFLVLSINSTASGFSMGGGQTCTSTISVMPNIDKLDPVSENIKSPTDIAVDAQGRLYVADLFDNSVKLYSPGGKYLTALSGFAQPVSVAVGANGHIYVGNKQRGNVEVFDAEFNYLFKLGSGDGEFNLPSDIEIDVFGRVFVADTNNDKVKIFRAANGSPIGVLGGSGTNDGEFYRPVSVAIDDVAQEIIVLDRNPGMWGDLEAKVQFFNLNGGFLRSFKAFGPEEGQMTGPQRIVVDSQSRIYLSDSLLNSVLVYDNVGCSVGVVFEQVNHPRTPLGMAIGNNKLYVTSHVSHGIEVYGLYEQGVYGYMGMKIDPVSMEFAASEGDDNLKPRIIGVENTGNVLMNWSATTEDSWLQLSGESFTNGILGPDELNQFNVEFDTSGLAPGVYKGKITFTGNNRIQEEVEVTLTVQAAPIMSVLPGAISSESDTSVNPSVEIVTIANSGSAPLSWSAMASQPWMVLSKTSGVIFDSNSDPDAIKLLLNVTGLPAGTYTGEITVSGLEAYDSPATIPVNLVLNQTAHVYTVSVNTGPDGSLDPSTPAPQIVAYGETRSFTFHADEKCYVASISGCGIDYTNTNDTVTIRTETTGAITDSCTVVATFATDAMRLNVLTVGNGTGRVVSTLPGIDCPGDCQNLYDQGDLVTLTAEPYGSSKFGGWTGECTGMDLVCEVTMDQAISVEAKFTQFPWMILMPALMHNMQQGNSQ